MGTPKRPQKRTQPDPAAKTAGLELAWFFAASIGLSWLFWFLAFFLKGRGAQPPPVSPDLLVRIGGFVPSAAGIALAFFRGGKGEGGALLRSMVRVSFPLKWYLFLLVPPAGTAAACLLLVFTEFPLPAPSFPFAALPLAFLYILFVLGPLGEEAGWRGFALRRMLGRQSPFGAGLALGVLWTLWHVPLFFIPGTVQNALAAAYFLPPALLCYLFYTVLISLLITLQFVGSGGSVFGAMLFHAMANLSLGAAPVIFSFWGAVFLLALLAAVTAGIGYRFRRLLLARPN